MVNYALFTLSSDSFFQTEFSFISLNIMQIQERSEFSVVSSNFTIDSAFDSSDPDLFLYYNWVYSPSPIDFSGKHDPTAIIIDGPEWKTDENGGYLVIKPGDTLHVPNIPEVHGWRDASISLWMYLEEGGGAGFGFGQPPCTLHFSDNRLHWGSSITHDVLPFREWFHVVFTFDHESSRVYINRTLMTDPVVPQSPYQCSKGPPPLFPLSEIQPEGNDFQGKIRAVQFYTRTLTEDEITLLSLDLPQGIYGNGKLTFVDSAASFEAASFYIGSLSLTSSSLQSEGVVFRNLTELELYRNSVMVLSESTRILSDSTTITLHSSELYCDDTVDISSPILNFVAINSHFLNHLSNFNSLNLSYSTFESTVGTEVFVGFFSCFYCQILGNWYMAITSKVQISSGNFSSSLIVQESADTTMITGLVKLANSIDVYSHVILDDVLVSEFQFSPNGSITCHSDVSMRNAVGLSDVSFTFNNTLALLDSTVRIAPLFVLFDFQTMSGFGTIDTNILNFGKIRPSSTFTFNDNLSLAPSSIISLQISNDSSSTHLIVGSTAYLDGILEIEFDTKSDSTSYKYTLIESDQINGRFRSIINPCASLITTFYSKSSLIVSVNDFVVDLQQGSYVSPSGVDDSCCGTFDSPCASFKGVLERMGRKGKVYFHSGYYFFNQGFGKLIDVDWEVIGLGDVIIDGSDDTLLDNVSSSLTFHNLIIYGKNVVLEVSNSSINFDFVSVLSISNDSLFLIENSSFTTTNSLFDIESFRLFECLKSSIFVDNSFFSGSLSDSLISLSSSSMIVDNTILNNLNVSNLIVSSTSSIKVNHSSISHVTANTVFLLDQSDIVVNILSIAFFFIVAPQLFL
ncbi:hypothetical protein GEMRC1_008854 [Eukaryota sp. GEM-RC1]